MLFAYIAAVKYDDARDTRLCTRETGRRRRGARGCQTTPRARVCVRVCVYPSRRSAHSRLMYDLSAGKVARRYCVTAADSGQNRPLPPGVGRTSIYRRSRRFIIVRRRQSWYRANGWTTSNVRENGFELISIIIDKTNKIFRPTSHVFLFFWPFSIFIFLGFPLPLRPFCLVTVSSFPLISNRLPDTHPRRFQQDVFPFYSRYPSLSILGEFCSGI